MIFQACNFIKKETLARVFPCDFCEIFENTFFYRTPPMAASKKKSSNVVVELLAVKVTQNDVICNGFTGNCTYFVFKYF